MGRGCFFLSFGVYLAGAYPSISTGDSGEFITAGATLGNPHPPAFPTYTLLGRLTQSAIPWANPGYRANLLSSLTGAAAILVLFLLMRAMGVSPILGAAAALAFGLSAAQRVNAGATEVFQPHLLIALAVLWAAVARQWRLAAFLLGIGAGNHQTIVLLGPALAYFFWTERRAERPSLTFHEGIVLLAAFVLGLSVYLAVLLRAAQHPLLNVGRPDTWERWWRVLSRADYGSLTLALGETPDCSAENVWRHLVRFGEGLTLRTGLVAAAGLLAGLVAAFRRPDPRTRGLLLALIFIGPFFFLLGNLPFDAQSKGLLERFLLLPGALGVALLALVVPDRWRAWTALAVLFVGVGSAWAAMPFGVSRQDFRAYDYGRNNLRTLAPGSVFAMDGGDDTFYSLAYLTQAERRRPDLRFFDRGGVVFPGLYGDDFRKLPRPEKEPRRQAVESALVRSGQPLYYSTMNAEVLPGIPLQAQGILYAAPTAARANSFWDLYALRGIFPWSAREAQDEYRIRALTPFYAYQRAMTEAAAGRIAEARLWMASAWHQGSDVLWLRPNVIHALHLWAYGAIQKGDLAQAKSLYEQLLFWQPNDATAWGNLGAVEERLGNLDQAIVNYEKAAQLDPRSASGHFNLATVYWKRQRWDAVVRELTLVVAIQPDYPNGRSFLMKAQTLAAKANGR